MLPAAAARSSPGALGLAALLLCLGALGCERWPTSSPAAGTPTSAPGASARAAAASPAPPSLPACEGLWREYHAIVPESPYVDHDGLVARCTRSEPAVLGCVARTKAVAEDIVARVADSMDAGPPEPVSPRFLQMVVGTRIGACVTRERLLFAERTGELGRLVHEIASGSATEGPYGTRVVGGSYATLPWRGVHEGPRSAERAPEGEIRVSRRKDGRVWLYFLGALLGRHQNQIGFVYGDAPFVATDFSPEAGEGGGPARESVCLEDGEREHGGLFMLSCFTVEERLSPQLIQVGAAPS
jgi:hypothetical protein